MNYVTLFPQCENVHLIKDVGMIPYIMYKYFNYDAKIACYKNGSYDYLKNEVKGLKIDFIKRYTGNEFIDSCIYLVKNSRNIDVLHIFHLSKRSLIWGYLFKLFNKKGKLYLKLDADSRILKYDFKKKNLKLFITLKLLKKCDVISNEIRCINKKLNENWPYEVKYIPNGFYDDNEGNGVYEEKENIICTVGRIGTYQKATETLLEGYKMAYKDISNWKLRIIGPIEDEFKKYINKFYLQNPNLKQKVKFTGPIYNRQKLEIEYRKAKIFCLTSRYESFGLVFLEAMKNGCFVITSKVESVPDITNNGTYGKVFSIDSASELAKHFIQICNQENKIKQNYKEVQEYVYDKFSWINICKDINKYLKV